MRVHHHRGTPPFARPRGHRAKTTMVYTILMGKQRKRVYTIGPERRVYTIEASDDEKKRGGSTVLLYPPPLKTFTGMKKYFRIIFGALAEKPGKSPWGCYRDKF